MLVQANRSLVVGQFVYIFASSSSGSSSIRYEWINMMMSCLMWSVLKYYYKYESVLQTRVHFKFQQIRCLNSWTIFIEYNRPIFSKYFFPLYYFRYFFFFSKRVCSHWLKQNKHNLKRLKKKREEKRNGKNINKVLFVDQLHFGSRNRNPCKKKTTLYSMVSVLCFRPVHML